MKKLLAVMAFAGFVALASAQSRAPPSALSNELLLRYPNGTIYLGPTALNDIRTILREPERRRRIDAEAEPLPTGARTLQTYTEAIYRSSLDATRGVLLLMIDFEKARAFEKRATDSSGGVVPLPWLPEEVRAAAALSDRLIRTGAAYDALFDSLRDDQATVISSWAAYRKVSDEPLITDERMAPFVQLFVSKARKNPNQLEFAKSQDPEAYGQIQALLLNQASVDSASIAFSASAPVKSCGAAQAVSLDACIALKRATAQATAFGLKASQHRVVLSDDDAKRAIRSQFELELKALKGE